METCFSEVLFWIVVVSIIVWMIKLLALKIWNKKLPADLRGQISARGGRSFRTFSNESQENEGQNLRKEPGENDERESRNEPQENDEMFS